MKSVRARVRALHPAVLAASALLLAAFAVAAVPSARAAADHLITGNDIAKHTITHANLHDNAVTSNKILDGHVYRRDLAPGVQSALDQRAADGTNGVDGKDGATGDTGLKGDTGDVGPQGPKGDTGDTGPKGDTGDTGPQGPKGDTGPSTSATIVASGSFASGAPVSLGTAIITTAAGRLNINGVVQVRPGGSSPSNIIACRVFVDGADPGTEDAVGDAPGGWDSQVVIANEATVAAGTHNLDLRCASNGVATAVYGGRVNIIATG